MKEKIQSETVRERTHQGEKAQKIPNAEDRALKMAAQFFGKELLEQLGIKGRIKDIFPAENVFQELENKPVRDWKREELLEVALSPLMGGKMTQEERIRQGFRILKKECPGVSKEDQKKLQSILYVFALKFLKKDELERMEEIRMTVLGQMLVDEGFHKGLSQGLKVFVETCKEMDISRKDTEARLQEKFELSDVESERYMEQYWK